jgi:hypothetical protein
VAVDFRQQPISLAGTTRTVDGLIVFRPIGPEKSLARFLLVRSEV